jgi:hypothetical protein
MIKRPTRIAAIVIARLSFQAHVGAELLHRTTRALKLSEAGGCYVAACRRVLIDLEEADNRDAVAVEIETPEIGACDRDARCSRPNPGAN